MNGSSNTEIHLFIQQLLNVPSEPGLCWPLGIEQHIRWLCRRTGPAAGSKARHASSFAVLLIPSMWNRRGYQHTPMELSGLYLIT